MSADTHGAAGMAAAVLAAAALVLSGCLSVTRVPVGCNQKYSDDGVCTNRVWYVPMDDIMRGDRMSWGVFPTVEMRCVVTRHICSPVDETKTGEALYYERRKYWALIPLAVLWATSPLDALVDVAYVAHDMKVKGE